MATSYRQPVVLNTLSAAMGGNMSYESVLVTVTATMQDGSMLIAAGTEAAAADAATVTGIIDFPQFEVGDYQVGDVILVPVVIRDAVVNMGALHFSDAAYGTEALTALATAGVRLQSVTTSFTRN
ncbi:hypothetical protein S140_112 [Shewanella sp. phage 1/40]|uniref:head decoration n=1 Tax=Shewanella sp. phage 1/40 TaxID=1458860 RepID=UPI0004F82006|nr:head decoration [Shewanella sp. phage 1/40]AHK11519.1 hypothetical protein S140_112 [Shewanella sp. phage 1/40]